MKKRKKTRAAMCAAFLFLCCCLSGCSFSFCGLQAGGKKEMVFSCQEEEEVPDKSAENPQVAEVETETEGFKPAEEKAQAEDSSANESDGGKVDLNTADIEELTTLNGIGEGRAKAIVEYRTQKGPFAEIEDIMQVPGIKEGIFSKIKDQIVVH